MLRPLLSAKDTMQLQEARMSFIEQWGALSISWGVNRLLGQIHGLLLISHKPLCADEIMEALDISRGSVNTNLRILIDWELVSKEHITDNRKEYFVAQKDMWVIFCQIVKQRRKKELDPLLYSLDDLQACHSNCEQSEEFIKVITSLSRFSGKVDKALQQIVKEQPNMLVSAYLKV